jgi:signal recognition particle GTPase
LRFVHAALLIYVSTTFGRAYSNSNLYATGAGVQVQEVNRLLKQFEQTQKMMKHFSKGSIGKLLRGIPGFR